MRNKILAGTAASVMLLTAAAGVAGSANAATKDAGPKQFPTTISPSKSVKPGTVLTLKGTKATPNTAYYCVLAAVNVKGVSAPDNASLKVVKSNAKGAVNCKLTYKPFKGTDKASGKTYSCPPTPKDKKAGIECVGAFADQATIGALSIGAAVFTPVK